MPNNHPLYATAAWRRISKYVRFERALGCCEHCGVPHGAIAADGRSIIFLNCAHLNGDRSDLRLENLRALCPRCHFAYDELSRLLLGQRAKGGASPRPARRHAGEHLIANKGARKRCIPGAAERRARPARHTVSDEMNGPRRLSEGRWNRW